MLVATTTQSSLNRGGPVKVPLINTVSAEGFTVENCLPQISSVATLAENDVLQSEESSNLSPATSGC